MPKVNKLTSSHKCQRCRHDRQKCLPECRIWPGSRCDRCQRYDYTCSASRTKVEEQESIPKGSLTSPLSTSSHSIFQQMSICQCLQEIGDLKQLLESHRLIRPFARPCDIGISDYTKKASDFLESRLVSVVDFLKGRAEQYTLDGQYKDAEYIKSQIFTPNSIRNLCSAEIVSDDDMTKFVSLYIKMGNFSAAEAIQEKLVRKILDDSGCGDFASHHARLCFEVEALTELYNKYYQRIKELDNPDVSNTHSAYRAQRFDDTLSKLAHIRIVQCAASMDIIQLTTSLSQRSLLGVPEISLHIAAKNGAINMVRMLLKTNEYRINGKDAYGATALHIAAQNSHAGIVELLVQSKADLEAANDDLRTPLHTASLKEGAEYVVLVLLRAGADMTAKDKDGRTALYLAAKAGLGTTVEILLRQNLHRESTQETVLHMATVLGFTSIVKLLLNDYKRGTTSRDLHIDTSNTDELLRGTERCSQEAMLEARNKLGNTALHTAVLGRHRTITRMLVERGADIEARDKYGRTALHLAASQRDKGFVQILLDMNASCNARDCWGCTPLHNAAASKSEKAIVRLVNDGADIEARDNNGKTPLVLAAYGGYINGTQGPSTRSAVRGEERDRPGLLDEDDGKVVQQLLLCRANIESQDCTRQTALAYAVDRGSQMTTSNLLAAGADTKVRDENGRTVLHKAAAGGYEGIVRMLLKKGAMVDAKDRTGFTVFDVAKSRGQTAMMQLLNHYRR